MALLPHLALPNYLNEDIWGYYELLQVSLTILNDHLVVILQAPLVDESLIMNVYKAYNLLLLHPVLQMGFSIFSRRRMPCHFF